MTTHHKTTAATTTRLVPAKVVARETGIPYGSLRDIVHRGELAVIKIGRAWYFERADLTRWIETHKERFEAQ